jgi:hypothetical protein
MPAHVAEIADLVRRYLDSSVARTPQPTRKV